MSRVLRFASKVRSFRPIMRMFSFAAVPAGFGMAFFKSQNLMPVELESIVSQECVVFKDVHSLAPTCLIIAFNPANPLHQEWISN